MESKIIKEAFSKPARELRAKVTIGDKVFTDEHLEIIRAVTGLSESNDFEVGTAFMASATIKLVDKYENFRESNFKDKMAKVEIGVKTLQDFDYTSIGEFIVDSVGSNMKSWELKCYDLMHKFNVKYDCKLTFPASLKSIVLDICNICGVEPSDNIKNSTLLDRIIKFKPNFYDMTAREVLAQVAELICAWAYIDVDSQKLDISGYAVDDEIKINDNNLISFKEYKNTSNSDCKILLDSVKIIQNGADDADYNPGSSRKFHIVDNMFIQGNGADYIDNAKKSFKFNELSALSIKYNGNPGLRPARCVKVIRAGKEYNFLPLVRKLTYNGGLVEECECKQINYDPANRRKEIVRHVEKINALLKVMDDKIQSKVGTEDFQTLVEQTKEEIKLLAKNITLEGYVKFEDLKKQNKSTVIHGGNITTGVIQSKDGGFGIDLDNKTFFLGRDLEHYALLFDGEKLNFGTGGIKSDQFSEGLKQELKGQDGQSQYVHTRYSDSGGDVGAMHVNAVNDSGEPYKYIGFAITNSSGAPALKSAYKWTKYVGDDGTNGTPGKPGADGKTPYFHVAWADSSDGSVGFTTHGGTDKKYMGTYTDFTLRDSENYSDYTWVRVKGNDGESFRFNLLSNGDFHEDFTEKGPGYYRIPDVWQVRKKEELDHVKIQSADGQNVLTVDASGSNTVLINQIVNLKKNTKYYMKIMAASRNMWVYYFGSTYDDIVFIKEATDTDFKIHSGEFTTEADTNLHGIQLDCRSLSKIKWIILSEEPIHSDKWYPSQKDLQGKDGKDGSFEDLPPALKAWNGKATEISGEYVFTPELFIGNGAYENKTGVYVGNSIRTKFHGEWYNIAGMVGMENGEANWMFTHSGNFILGRKPGENIQLGADGRAIIPMIKTNMIEAGAITADKIEAGAITAEKIKSGEITTDFLYPGTNERIILERGYDPGSNDCKSIDANGGAIRLKANSGTYIAMRQSGGVGMYSGGDLFFNFNPNEEWIYNDGERSGSGVLSLYDARVSMGWLQYYIYTVRSDRRVKNNIKYIEDESKSINRSNIFDFVKTVDLATYQYKKFSGSNLSMIAQDVQRFRFIQDYLVVKDSEGLLSINMGNYTATLHIALQEEIKKREALEDKVSKLEEELAGIKKLLKERGIE
jgi:phage minor structural protein, N-terminal domain protein